MISAAPNPLGLHPSHWNYGVVAISPMFLPFLAFTHHQSLQTLIRKSHPKHFFLPKTKHQLLSYFNFFLVIWHYSNTWCARFSSCLQDDLSNTEKRFSGYATGSAAFPLGGTAASAERFLCHSTMTNSCQHHLIHNSISAHISGTTQHSTRRKWKRHQVFDGF